MGGGRVVHTGKEKHRNEYFEKEERKETICKNKREQTQKQNTTTN